MKAAKFGPVRWAAVIGSFLLGLVCWMSPGYRFSGLCLFGLTALIPLFYFLELRAKQAPKPWKGVKRLLTGLLALLLLAMSVTLGVLLYFAQGTPEAQSPDLIVLGAGVNGTVPSRSLRERLDAAYDYLLAHPDSHAIVSGGQGAHEDISEAECMLRYLTDRGIDPQRVWMEDQATNTLENLRFSLEVIEAHRGTAPKTVAIVSSEYHLCRARLFAGWLGLEAELVPAKTGIVPLRCNYYLREIFALWYYQIFGGIYNA